VTIIAGFKCGEGVIICADTQETVGDIKRNVPKLRFEPSGAIGVLGTPRGLAAAFCGATNNGVFLDEIVDDAWKNAQRAASLDEACELIKASLKNSYKEFGRIYQVGFCPDAELIYGVKMGRTSRLFYALGPAIVEKEGYSTGGQGIYMSDFLTSRMYRDHLSLRQCVILAAYVLFEAKEHVVGCGGHSEIAVLRNDEEHSGVIDWGHTKSLTDLVSYPDQPLGRILLDFANLDLDDEAFQERATKELKSLMIMRAHERDQLQQWDSLWKAISGGHISVDDFGLPK
jgi:20S proteasome alpha/beta subunit